MIFQSIKTIFFFFQYTFNVLCRFTLVYYTVYVLFAFILEPLELPIAIHDLCQTVRYFISTEQETDVEVLNMQSLEWVVRPS